MLVWIIIIVLAIVTYKFLFSDVEKRGKSVDPPTGDVVIIGCNCECGYATLEFEENENGDYNSTNMIYCDYQRKRVRKGSKCPYAKDHPDKLRKSLFDD